MEILLIAVISISYSAAHFTGEYKNIYNLFCHFTLRSKKNFFFCISYKRIFINFQRGQSNSRTTSKQELWFRAYFTFFSGCLNHNFHFFLYLIKINRLIVLVNANKIHLNLLLINWYWSSNQFYNNITDDVNYTFSQSHSISFWI